MNDNTLNIVVCIILWNEMFQKSRYHVSRISQLFSPQRQLSETYVTLFKSIMSGVLGKLIGSWPPALVSTSSCCHWKHIRISCNRWQADRWSSADRSRRLQCTVWKTMRYQWTIEHQRKKVYWILGDNSHLVLATKEILVTCMLICRKRCLK